MDQATTGILATALVVMLCTCGCSTNIPPSQSPPDGQNPPGVPNPSIEGKLEGMTWYLVVFHTASGRSVNVLPGTEITVYLDGSRKINGNAGCNQYTATYTVSSDLLTIGSPATTKMYCASPTGTMTQEATYLAMLQRVARSRIEGNLLTLMDEDGAPLFAFSTAKITFS